VLWPLAAAAEQVQHRIAFAYHIGKNTRSWLKGVSAGDAVATARGIVAKKRSEQMASRAGIVGSYMAPDERRSAHASGAAVSVRVLPDPVDPTTGAAGTLFVPIRLGPRACEAAEKKGVRKPSDGPLCLHHDPRTNETVAKNTSFLNFSICSAIATEAGSEVPFVHLDTAFHPLDRIARPGPLSLFEKWREALARCLPAVPCAGCRLVSMCGAIRQGGACAAKAASRVVGLSHDGQRTKTECREALGRHGKCHNGPGVDATIQGTLLAERKSSGGAVARSKCSDNGAAGSKEASASSR
jgi:hypothetical protein